MSTVTVSGKQGPNITVAAAVYQNVTQFDMNSNSNILTIWQGGKVSHISILAATTITCTVVGGQYSLVVS